MRRRSADSIKASGREMGPHQQAAYMNAPDLRCRLIRILARQGPSIHEAFDEAVLARAARGDVGGACADGCDPVLHCFCDELGSIVGTDMPGQAAQNEEIRESIDNVYG